MLKVVDSVSNPRTEIHVEKAQALKPGAVLGEMIEKEIDPSTLGRIAAQTARQAVMQRLRQFEKDRIYDDFKDQVGNIVTGTVRRRERNDIYIDLGKAEAVMPAKEQMPGEEYQPGDRIRSLLLEIENTPRGPEIILSRASAKFVRRLFELEVTEIADGTVKIEAFAREPGYRTKIAVTSTDPKVDPVGACVGRAGRAGEDDRARAGRREDRHHQVFRRSAGDDHRGASSRPCRATSSSTRRTTASCSRWRPTTSRSPSAARARTRA